MADGGRILLERAYVLHRRPYRDSSLIVELLSRRHGRVAVVARGARRPRSRYQGLLEPFHPLLASWGGRGELATLGAVEAASGCILLPAPLLAHGFYLNELLLRLLHRNDPCEVVFRHYEEVLGVLGRDPAAQALQRALRLFEKRLLEALGYGLSLRHDCEGAAVEAQCRYYYVPQLGARRLAENRGEKRKDSSAQGDGAGVEILGSSLLALADETLPDARSLRECKRLLRRVLTGLLGGHPLHSRRLLIPDTRGQMSDVRQQMFKTGGDSWPGAATTADHTTP